MLWSQCPTLCCSAQKACIHTGKLEVWSGSEGPAYFPGACRPQVCFVFLRSRDSSAAVLSSVFEAARRNAAGLSYISVFLEFFWLFAFLDCRIFYSLCEVTNYYIRGNALLGGRGFSLGNVEF